jgi:outer membrane protein assembly factor BamA
MALDWTTSLVTLTDDGLPPEEIGPSTYFLTVLGLTQTYDRRNDVAVPTDGYYGSLSTDVGLSLGEGAVSFARGEARFGVYEPVTRKSHVALGARIGAIVPSSSSTGLPVDLRYFLGGANSVRSFPARELGPEAANGIPRGGQAYWVANAEYVHDLLGPVNGVLFLDAGSLSRQYAELLGSDVKYALGLGLRLDLPIGSVRLEYGHSLNPERNDPTGAFHFAIGSAF